MTSPSHAICILYGSPKWVNTPAWSTTDGTSVIAVESKERKFMTYSHENMIFVCPPLIITEEQIKEELVKLDEVLSIVDSTYI